MLRGYGLTRLDRTVLAIQSERRLEIAHPGWYQKCRHGKKTRPELWPKSAGYTISWQGHWIGNLLLGQTASGACGFSRVDFGRWL